MSCDAKLKYIEQLELENKELKSKLAKATSFAVKQGDDAISVSCICGRVAMVKLDMTDFKNENERLKKALEKIKEVN